MSDEHRLLLLRIIEFDGNVQPLIGLNYSFSNVTKAIRAEVNDGNAMYEKGELKITEKGLTEIENLEKAVNRKYPWIEPEHESKTTALGKDEIYVPSRNSINYLFK